MDKIKKEEKKVLYEDIDGNENEEPTLDGKGLHDLYRHTTKLMK